MKKSSADESLVYEDMLKIIAVEICAIKVKGKRDEDDLKSLYNLARVYAILKDDLREDVKAGVFDKAEIESNT